MDVAVRRIGGRTKQDARVETAGSSLQNSIRRMHIISNLLLAFGPNFILDPAVEPRDDKYNATRDDKYNAARDDKYNAARERHV